MNCSSADTKTTRSFRLTCAPEKTHLVEKMLEDEGFRFIPEPFSKLCRQLLHEPFPLGSSLAAFFGYIYIQDRSSMLPPLALGVKAGESVLDMAASPGSKTGFLCQLVGDSGFVLANEPNQSRHATLLANLRTLNFLQAATCSYPGQDIPLETGRWNRILLDPPCSGWGTAKKNPSAPKIWQGTRIAPLIALQRKLLAHAAALLRPGGQLLYSTCTTNPAENQDQTDYAASELGLEQMEIEPFPGFIFDDCNCKGLLVNGEASQSQGFYLSLLRKRSGSGAAGPVCQPQDFSAHIIPTDSIDSAVCDSSLLPPGRVAVFNGKACFLPDAAAALVPTNMKWRGYALGRFARGCFSPFARLRRLMPRTGGTPRIIIDSIAELRSILSGAAHEARLDSCTAGLWYGDLPLGICQLKNGRVIAAFR